MFERADRMVKQEVHTEFCLEWILSKKGFSVVYWTAVTHIRVQWQTSVLPLLHLRVVLRTREDPVIFGFALQGGHKVKIYWAGNLEFFQNYRCNQCTYFIFKLNPKY
jgi:hypothetical protein